METIEEKIAEELVALSGSGFDFSTQEKCAAVLSGIIDAFHRGSDMSPSSAVDIIDLMAGIGYNNIHGKAASESGAIKIASCISRLRNEVSYLCSAEMLKRAETVIKPRAEDLYGAGYSQNAQGLVDEYGYAYPQNYFDSSPGFFGFLNPQGVMDKKLNHLKMVAEAQRVNPTANKDIVPKEVQSILGGLGGDKNKDKVKELTSLAATLGGNEHIRKSVVGGVADATSNNPGLRSTMGDIARDQVFKYIKDSPWINHVAPLAIGALGGILPTLISGKAMTGSLLTDILGGAALSYGGKYIADQYKPEGAANGTTHWSKTRDSIADWVMGGNGTTGTQAEQPAPAPAPAQPNPLAPPPEDKGIVAVPPGK